VRGVPLPRCNLFADRRRLAAVHDRIPFVFVTHAALDELSGTAGLRASCSSAPTSRPRSRLACGPGASTCWPATKSLVNNLEFATGIFGSV